MQGRAATKDVSSNPSEGSFQVDLQVKMNPRFSHCRSSDLLTAVPKQCLIFIRALYTNANKKHSFYPLNRKLISH